jgi:hypothetical protein
LILKKGGTMTAVDLIIELSKLPPEMDVVYDNTMTGEHAYRLVYVENAKEIQDDIGRRFILLNCMDAEEED